MRCGGLFAAKAKAQKRQGFPSPDRLPLIGQIGGGAIDVVT